MCLWSAEPFGVLGRQVQQQVPVGDVGDQAGIGEAETTRCLYDETVEDVEFRDVQHMLDRTDLLAALHLVVKRDWPTTQYGPDVPTGEEH